MNECRFCKQGDVPIRSSVSGKMVHMDATGHKMCEKSGIEEPSWIRDTQAAVLIVGGDNPGVLPSEAVAQICDGETTFCDYCGAGFPMWPTKSWADHIATKHAEEITIQARGGVAMLCQDEVNEGQGAFFQMMLGSRVSMRRRAWKLGLLRAQPEKPRLVS